MYLAKHLLCMLALTPLSLGVAVTDQSKERTLCVPHGSPSTWGDHVPYLSSHITSAPAFCR